VAAAVWTSPVFAVRQVQVFGTTQVAVKERTQAEQVSTLPAQTNFLLMSTSGVQKKLSGLMWVKHAEVSRRLPNIVEAHVTPRIPFALVTVAGTTYEADAQGFPIRTASPENSRLPHLILARNVPVVAGKTLNDVALTQTLVALRGMETGLRERMVKIVIDPQGNLCLNMSDGVAIQCGQAENLDSKFALVRRIYEREPTVGERLVGINISVPEQPACTPRIVTPEPAAPIGNEPVPAT
jgi:cell division septal protein FtsQ